ncbi:hypothetical protein F8568_028855 [Actinomadura sp. LD22]|uniref:Transcriptional regulator n=1 Tax=Actinomadura physcomitrii TaxID=2650748 RepID=A0A6I4MDJ3_9ACTN|nr:hypothetical protein [Actinomadura physcomitrii]MWA04318.1 hypothetical protein [Actinomadura physcomitrii]
MIEIRNTALDTELARIGIPLTAVADQINQVAEENNCHFRYNASSLSHWLTGRTPQPERIPVIVEAFRRLLVAPGLRAADLGWEEADQDGEDPEGADPWRADPMTWLDHLGRLDMYPDDRVPDHRPGRRTLLFSLAAAAVPAASGAPPRPSPSPGRTAGSAEAARIREVSTVFSDLDDRFGGAHVRASIAAYLTNHVVPVLRHASPRSRPALFAAAAEMSYLAGWMASDAGKAGIAQGYYIQSVRMAVQADDYRLKATTLRAMALQAVELGHTRHGRDLADAAERTLPASAPPRLRSWITAMRAEAHAADGESQAARILLKAAERDLERASSSQAPDWTGSSYSHAALRHQTGTTLASAGDLAPAEEYLSASLIGRPGTQRRSRSLIGTRLAALQLRRNQPDAAALTVESISSDLTMVVSARVDRELGRLRANWSKARSDPTVSEIDHFVAGLIRQRA